MRRRRRQVVFTGALVLLAAGLLAGLSFSGSSAPGSTSPTETSPSVTTTTVPLPIEVSPMHQVALTDTCASCSTENFVTGASSSGRTLVTDVWFPTRGGVTATAGLAPLIVFAPGYALDPSEYLPLLDAWVKAGFVVAAPLFPDTNAAAVAAVEKVYPDPGMGGDPHPSPEVDVANQPSDLAFVMSRLVQDDNSDATGAASFLYGLFDPSEIGIAGQSDGGDTVAALGYNSCCRADVPKPVGAVVVLSGAEGGFFSGSWFSGSTIPLLVTQGTDDACNSPQLSDTIYDGAPTNVGKAFLVLEGADHLESYTAANPFEQVVAKVTTDFFEIHLHFGTATPASMARAGSSTHSSFSTAAQAPALSPMSATWSYNPGSTLDPCSINFTGPPGTSITSGT